MPTNMTSAPKLLTLLPPTSLTAAPLLVAALELALALLATLEGVIPPAAVPLFSTLMTLLKYPLTSPFVLLLPPPPLALFVGTGSFGVTDPV